MHGQHVSGRPSMLPPEENVEAIDELVVSPENQFIGISCWMFQRKHVWKPFNIWRRYRQELVWVFFMAHRVQFIADSATSYLILSAYSCFDLQAQYDDEFVDSFDLTSVVSIKLTKTAVCLLHSWAACLELYRISLRDASSSLCSCLLLQFEDFLTVKLHLSLLVCHELNVQLWLVRIVSCNVI